MQNIIEFSEEQDQLERCIIELLDDDQICTGIAINADPATTDGLLDAVMGCDQKYPQCPKCFKAGQKKVNIKDGTNQCEMKEAIIGDGRHIRLTLIRQRHECDCGKVFFSNIPQRLRPGAQARKAAYKAIKDGSLVLSQNSIGVTFSKAEGSTVLNDVVSGVCDVVEGIREPRDEYERNAAETFKKIASFKECGTLFFVPFQFKREDRCCVCGLSGSTAYLLDILESASAEAIDECITKHVKGKDRVRYVYCFVDDEVVRVLKKHFTNASIRYSRKCLQDYIRICCKDSHDAELDSKSSFRIRIMNIIKKETHDQYLSSFLKWWGILGDTLQQKAYRIYNKFCDDVYQDVTDRTFESSFGCSSFASLLGWIRENGNSSFIVMKYRMLLNHYFRNNGVAVNLSVAMPQMQNIEDFGVDIDEILKDQERYHQFVEDVLGEKFKKVPKQSEIMKELFEELERE